MTALPHPTLSLADLEAYDPSAPPVRANGERRFLCPLCGDGKPRNNEHRSLCANLSTGAWRCWRSPCDATGKLTDFWQERPIISPKARARAAYDSVFALAPESAQGELAPSVEPTPRMELVTPVERLTSQDSLRQDTPESIEPWRALWRDARPLAGTPGAQYLEKRAVPLQVATAAGACYCPLWHRGAAVLFPLSDRDGNCHTPIAAQGRHLRGAGKFTEGEKKRGVFRAPAFVDNQVWLPFDRRVAAVIITEGPCDALSVAACGFPALALIGTSGPDWLAQACAFRRVMLATDADEAGDKAALSLAPRLASLAAEPLRLRPNEAHEWAKDWNDALRLLGCEALTDYLSSKILL